MPDNSTLLASQPSDNIPGLTHMMQRNLAAVQRIETQLLSERSAADVVVDRITAFCGSLSFIWIHLAWYGGWVLVNVLGPQGLRFDPYPFNFLTLAVSLEAIFLSTFILITQNRQARLNDLREGLDLQINLLGEEETTRILSMLQQIQEHLGIACNDPELAEMEQQFEPEALAAQLEHLMEHK